LTHTAFHVDELEVDVLEPRLEMAAVPAFVSTCVGPPSPQQLIAEVEYKVQHLLPPSTCVVFNS
jgi:hypothetical protein